MNNIEILDLLIKIAQKLDTEERYAEADRITEYIKQAVENPKMLRESKVAENIRVAWGLGDAWQGIKDSFKGYTKNLGDVAKGIGGMAVNTAKGVGQVASLPAAAAWDVGNAAKNTAENTGKAIGTAINNKWQNYLDQVIGERLQPIQKQQMAQQIESALAAATTAHKQGQSGWSVLNAAIANLPPNIQKTVKQQFMNATGVYTTNQKTPAPTYNA